MDSTCTRLEYLGPDETLVNADFEFYHICTKLLPLIMLNLIAATAVHNNKN